ncbi:MAG: hypothetical protein GXP40_01360 [Chloroflexi bacterium]|nr:hypothetical protein [Chloroflexota bacterium]
MNLTAAAAGLLLVLLSAGLLLGLSLLKRKSKASFRDIPAFTRLQKAIGTAVEDGTRLHFSLGRSDLVTPRSAASFATLGMLRRIAEVTSASDRPPVATSGDAALAILTQDTLQAAYQAAGAGQQYRPTTGRLTGLTPFAYAAGALSVIRDENVSANILAGGFGVEVALLTDAAERENAFALAAADDLAAQAVLYASAQEPLIGEELYAAGAYVQAGPTHTASLHVQDILRWLIVLVMLGGAAMKLVGVL